MFPRAPCVHSRGAGCGAAAADGGAHHPHPAHENRHHGTHPPPQTTVFHHQCAPQAHGQEGKELKSDLSFE